MKPIMTVSAVIIALALAGTVHASDPVAVYALVDKVIMEPAAGSPERIQIRGVFAIAKANDRNYYEAPQQGYMYFKLPTEKQDLARKEWADLKEMAGAGKAVAFGNRHQMKAKVRKADEKPETPDVYEVGFGLVKLRSDTDYRPVKSLLEYPR